MYEGLNHTRAEQQMFHEGLYLQMGIHSHLASNPWMLKKEENPVSTTHTRTLKASLITYLDYISPSF
jgi:hypothetical protein